MKYHPKANVIPFESTQEQFRERIRQSLMVRDNLLDDFVRNAVVSPPRRHYLAAYHYEGTFNAAWTASFGYDRKIQRHHPQRGSYWETVTDWKNAGGNAYGKFDINVLVGGMGLYQHLEGHERVFNFSLSLISAVPWSEELTKDVFVSSFFSDAKETLATLGAEQLSAVVGRAVKKNAQGNRQKNWNWSHSYTFDAVPYHIPMWSTILTYEGNEYEVIANGSGTMTLASGDFPTDNKRAARIRWGMVPFYATCITALTHVGVTRHSGLSVLVGVSCLLATGLYAGLRQRAIASHALKCREIYVKNPQANETELPRPPLLSLKKADWVLIPSMLVVSLMPLAFLLFSLLATKPSAVQNSNVSSQQQTIAVQPSSPVAAKMIEKPSTTASAPQKVANNMGADTNTPPTAKPAVTVPARTNNIHTKPTDAVVLPGFSPLLEPFGELLQAAANSRWDDLHRALVRRNERAANTPPAGPGIQMMARSEFNAGLKFAEDGNLAAAKAAYLRALATDPWGGGARTNYVMAAFETKEFDKAAAKLQEGLLMSPDVWEWWALLGLLEDNHPEHTQAALALMVHLQRDHGASIAVLRDQEPRSTPKMAALIRKMLPLVEQIPYARPL